MDIAVKILEEGFEFESNWCLENIWTFIINNTDQRKEVIFSFIKKNFVNFKIKKREQPL